MVLTHSTMLPLGTPAPDFALPDTGGRIRTLADFETEALVVIFTCNHCPYAVAVEQRLIALAREYAGHADFVAINANDFANYPADAPDRMAQRAAKMDYPFPYLYDESQAVARAYGAVCTPDIFLFDARRKLVYRGRFDDNWQDAAAVTREDLRMALDDTLAGRAVGFEQVPSMGCNIKWKG